MVAIDDEIVDISKGNDKTADQKIKTLKDKLEEIETDKCIGDLTSDLVGYDCSIQQNDRLKKFMELVAEMNDREENDQSLKNKSLLNRNLFSYFSYIRIKFKTLIMKKVLLVSVLGLFLFSCGKSACDCKEAGEALIKKTEGVTDKDELKKLQDEAKALEEECKDFSEEDYKDCK